MFYQQLLQHKQQQIVFCTLWTYFDQTFAYVELSRTERRHWLLTLEHVVQLKRDCRSFQTSNWLF